MRLLLLLLATLAAVIQRSRAYVYAISLRRYSGQGLVEYGLILVLIMVVCVAILTMMGQTISSIWYDKLVPALGP